MRHFAKGMVLALSVLTGGHAAVEAAPAELVATFPQNAQPMFWNLKAQLGRQSTPTNGVEPVLYFNIVPVDVPGYELWVSDGTPQGTHRAAPRRVETGSREIASPAFGLFFTGYDEGGLLQLFYTEGPEASARALTQLPLTSLSSLKSAIDNSALFSRPVAGGQVALLRADGASGAVDPVGQLPGSNSEIATANGYIIAPSLQTSIADHVTSFRNADASMIDLPVPAPNTGWDYPHRLASGERIACLKAFTHYAPDDIRQELYCSDGTIDGTRRPTVQGGSTGLWLPDNVVFHALEDRFLIHLISGAPWSTDGTDAGTFPLLDGDPVDWTFCSNNRLHEIYLTSLHGDSVRKLWKTDGTRGGTHWLADLDPASTGCSWRGESTGTSDLAYLQIGSALWQSDGTPSGTMSVVGVPALPFESGSREPELRFVALGRWLLFFAPASGTEGGLWRIDLDPLFEDGMGD